MLELQNKEINGIDLQYYDVSKLSKDEWVGFRSQLNRIGGSDVGTICGVNLYKDPLILFYEKIGVKENSFKGNDATILGTFFEESIREMWQYGSTLDEIRENFNKGRKVREAHDPLWTIINPAYPIFAANTDGLITKDPDNDYLGTGVLEIKKITYRASRAYKGGIPISYVYQLQAYMWVVGAKYGYISALVGEMDFITRPYYIDPEIVEDILQSCHRFWDAVTLGREIVGQNLSQKEQTEQLLMLEDTFSDVLSVSAYDKLSEWLAEPQFTDRRQGEIQPTPEIMDAAHRYYEGGERERAAKKEKESAGIELKRLLTKIGGQICDTGEYEIKFKKRLTVKKK